MRSFIKLFFIFSAVLLFFACDATSHKLENQIYIRFREINFSGDWTHFADTKVDSMEITLQKDIYLQEADAIKLKENITYSAGKQPSLPNLDTENPIIFRPNEKEPKLESVKTTFFRGNSADRTIDTNVGQRLRRGSINDLALTYDMRTESQVDFSASISNNETAIINSNEDGFYNFDVNVNHVKKSNFNTPNSINFVVMAEGYRTDEMRYFRSYVEDAFANYGNFHYTKRKRAGHDHVPNDFFKEWWDYINVFAFETVSPHSGIDTEFFRNYIQSFFNLNRANQLQFGSARMKKVIDVNMNKTGLHRKDVDVYILFVNDPKIWAYSFAYGITADNRRNGQQVTAVIIQAPAGREINADDFHTQYTSSDNVGVKTDAIAHELGHGMAQLMDEYKVNDITPPYLPMFRNISARGDGDYKWQKFIDYDNSYFDAAPVPMPYNNNKLVDITNPEFWGDREYYIPTMNSTMRGGSGTEASDNYQYGPVNTYFMEGSFMVRLGMLPPQNPTDLPDIFGFGPYYWNGYSVADFHKRWPPERFE